MAGNREDDRLSPCSRPLFGRVAPCFLCRESVCKLAGRGPFERLLAALQDAALVEGTCPRCLASSRKKSWLTRIAIIINDLDKL